MFAALWWEFPSKHSVMSHPSNSSLWDPVTLFSSLPTALTAWIKSTVTCVTTSPILLQTWGEYRFSSSPCLSVAATLQRSDVRASWLAALLTYSIWTPYRANTQDQSMKGHLGQSAHTAKAQGNDAHNADLIFPAVLYISVLLEFFFKYSAKNKICGACTTTFTLNRWVFLPQHVFECSESWYYFANTQGPATASQDGLGDF